MTYVFTGSYYPTYPVKTDVEDNGPQPEVLTTLKVSYTQVSEGSPEKVSLLIIRMNPFSLNIKNKGKNKLTTL